jgi:hypothetical protein
MSVSRRSTAAVLAVALLTSLLVAGIGVQATATPVADRDELLALYGRVFPDPHGCTPPGTPGTSPHANGNVCAKQFVQWDEAIGGLALLQQLYPRYVEVINLRTQYGDHPAFRGEGFRTAGIPTEDLGRQQRDLYVVKVTDRASPVPEADREHFVYSLSIHGIERAGLEGGIRAVEDLATWAACEHGDAPDAIDCAGEVGGHGARRLLDPYDEDGISPTAGETLEKGVLLFTLSNPDGWVRGDLTRGGVFYQRFNGNGMDLNRDWPTQGYSDPAYTSFSEPETRGFGRWLKWVADERTTDGAFAGGIDLHGMVTANSLSYTLLGAAQKDYRKNAITVETAELMFRDAEERLTWSPHVARAEDCPGPVPEPFFGQGRTTAPMCTVQWGTVWDTIEYQITGGMGDWIDNPDLGLGGIGINNEMALSHLAPNNVFLPDVIQLQIEGNKSLIYSQVAALLEEDPVTYEPGGRIAYLDDQARVQNDGSQGIPNRPELWDLPTQDDVHGQEVTGAQGFEFVVRGQDEGVFNGGMTIEATTVNARGIGLGVSATDLRLEYCGPAEGQTATMTHQHAHEHGVRASSSSAQRAAGAHLHGHASRALGGGRTMEVAAEGCEEVARAFNQGVTYAHAGAQLELNRPRPGVYRVASNAARATPTRYHVRFSRDDAIPGWDDQAPYDVSRLDFFRDLNAFVADGGHELVGLTADRIAADPDLLRTFDTFVVADRFTTTFGEAGRDEAYAAALEGFVRAGGNLVLTDGAVHGLAELGTGIAPDDVRRGVFYAGYIDFNDGEGPTFDQHPLTEGIELDGTASGRQTLDGTAYHDRRQTYEPVPTGHLVGGPTTCSSGCDAPIHVVDRDAWLATGGVHLGRSYVRPGPEGGAGYAGVSLGELPLGEGVVRIVGGLLPEPTTDNFHPYGLSSHALTYTGYQLFENATTWQNPGRVEGPPPGDGDDDGTGPGEPGDGETSPTLTCDRCALTIRAGSSDTAALTLDGGEATGPYALRVDDVPPRWEVTVEPAEGDLDGGGTTPVTVTVRVPNDGRGVHELPVALVVDDEVVDTATVSVEVIRGGPPPGAGPPDGRSAAMVAARAAVDGPGGVALGLLAAVGLTAAVLRRNERRAR